MAKRTIRRTVRFKAPFLLNGFDAPQPPGEYIIEEDEERIEGASTIAHRRVATYIHLPAVGARGTTREMVQIDSQDLEDALRRDSDA